MLSKTLNNTRILSLISLSNGLVFYAPVALLLRTSKGITPAEFFALQIILYGSICIFEIPCGVITDLIGYRKTIILSAFFLLIARINFLYASTFMLFAIEAIFESVSISFISGTMSAYLYEMYSGDDFDVHISKIDNFGTAGFVFSTIAFYFLYAYFGMFGLVLPTVLSSLGALIFSVMLSDVTRKRELDKKIYFKFFRNFKFWILSLYSSVFSLGFVAINYFYVIKLSSFNISTNNITFLIISYSVIQMFVPKLLSRINKYNYSPVILFVISLAFLLLYFNENIYLSLLFMVTLPSLIYLVYYKFSLAQNNFIDDMMWQNNRATLLSIFNMGSNFLSIFSLLILSIYNSASGLITFVVVGIIYMVLFLISIIYKI